MPKLINNQFGSFNEFTKFQKDNYRREVDSSNVTATLAVTEGADVAAFSATEIFTGILAVTEGADTAALAGTEKITATFAVTEGADVAAFAASEIFTATLSVTEGADAAALAATEDITATLAVTEGADIFAALGSVPSTETGPDFGLGHKFVASRDGRHHGVAITKKKWRELLEAREAQREAEERAQELKRKSDRLKVAAAADEAAQAIAAVQSTDEPIPEAFDAMTVALQAVASARTLVETLRQADLAAEYAQEVMREIDQDEEEAVMLLLL